MASDRLNQVRLQHRLQDTKLLGQGGKEVRRLALYPWQVLVQGSIAGTPITILSTNPMSVPDDVYFLLNEIRVSGDFIYGNAVAAAPHNLLNQMQNVMRLGFNIFADGRKQTIFDDWEPFGDLISPAGTMTPLTFCDSKFRPGEKLVLRMNLLAAWIGANDTRVGVTMIGEYIDRATLESQP